MTTAILQSIPRQRLSDGQFAYCLAPDRTLFRIPLAEGALEARSAMPVGMDQTLAKHMRAALLALELQEAGDEASRIELELLGQGVEVGHSLSELDEQGPPLLDVLTGQQLDEDTAALDPEILGQAERLAGLLVLASR